MRVIVAKSVGSTTAIDSAQYRLGFQPRFPAQEILNLVRGNPQALA